MTNRLPHTFVAPAGSHGYIVINLDSPRANPRRGYHDSIREVTFWGYSARFKREFIQRTLHELTETNMWCRLTTEVDLSKEELPDVFTINYGYDSGD